MNFKELKHHFVKAISPVYGSEEALFIFYIALEYFKKWNKNDFIRYLDDLVSEQEETKFKVVINDLKNGIPIQHVVGETFFYGLKFHVNPSVLIPRPETEELVEWVLSKSSAEKNLKNVLDVGTGSGCIAISLKKNSPSMTVSALDISSAALTVAKSNSLLNHAEVNFIEADIFSYSSNLIFDVIVSNPPYIKEEEKADMHQNVLDHEPHLALFVENNQPLLFYIAIADFAKRNLRSGGLLFFEINEFLPLETMDMLNSKGFKDVELKKDLNGKNRMICCAL